MRHPIGWALLMCVTVVLAGTSRASRIVKKTIQEKARQADFVLIARIDGLQDSGQKDEEYQFEKRVADCTVTEALVGDCAAGEVNVEVLRKPADDNRELPEGDRLEPGKSYILFLKQAAGRISLIAPWDSSMEVAEHYDVWDEDLKDDEEVIRGSACIINGVPLVKVTHADLVRKIRAAAKQEKPKLIWREDAGIRLEKVETPRGFEVSPQQAAEPLLARCTLAPWGVPYLFADVKYYYFGVADNRKPFPDSPDARATRIDGMTGKIVEQDLVNWLDAIPPMIQPSGDEEPSHGRPSTPPSLTERAGEFDAIVLGTKLRTSVMEVTEGLFLGVLTVKVEEALKGNTLKAGEDLNVVLFQWHDRSVIEAHLSAEMDIKRGIFGLRALPQTARAPFVRLWFNVPGGENWEPYFNSFRTNLPDVVHAQGDWELRVFYRQKRTKSEGLHGVLLFKGAEVPPAAPGEERQTALGIMAYWGATSDTPWAPTGWNFKDLSQHRHSWEKPMRDVQPTNPVRQDGPAQRELSMAALQAIDSGAIEFEDRQGKIFVTVIDRFKDAHRFTLNHEPLPREQVLEILKQKREDLQRRGMADGLSTNNAVPETEIETFMEKVRAEDFHGMWLTGEKVFVAGHYVPEHAKLFKGFPVTESEGRLCYEFHVFKGEAGAGSISLFMEKATGKIIMFSPVEATF